jgi:rubrerythrin
MDEALLEILDTAIYQEVAAQAVYRAAQSQTDDPAAIKLLRELEAEEVRHADWLKDLREGSARGENKCYPDLVPNLKLSDYLTAPETLHRAGFQETLVFAIKREQDAIDFYSRLTRTLADESAKNLCECLVQEGLQHKLKLELYYEELFLKEG